MPHDMFGDVVCPHVHDRRSTHRPPLMLASIGAHAVALVVAVVVSILAPDILPTPVTAKAEPFVMAVRMPPPVPLDRTRPARPKSPSRQPPVMSMSPPQPTVAPVAPVPAAPVQTPRGIGSEGPDTSRSGGGVGFQITGDIPVITGVVDGHRHFGATVAPPAPPSPVRLHSGMQAPRKTVDVAPTYPVTARSARVQGVVILEAVIDESGAVTSARVLRSIPMLDEAALTAVRQWRFEPARLNGSAVPVVMTVTVSFNLN